MKKILIFCLLIAATVSCCNKEAGKGFNYSSKIQKEQLNRGLYAIHNGGGNVTVTWRYLESDPLDVAFDVYRNGTKLNAAPLVKSTFFTDTNVDTTAVNEYSVMVSGKAAAEASYKLTPELAAKPYLDIPIKPVEGFREGYYAPNDITVGDLDGDGEYELVVKLETRTYDNSRGGICEEGNLLDAYKLDGTFMWRVDLGINIRQGAHYTQMSLFDFDGDGKAELAVKTAEGTKFGDGTVIGDTDGDGITDYREMDQSKRTYGMILSGPEFLSVIDGQTGKELARAPFIERGGPYEFGDVDGNRIDRYLGGAGYFDGKHPSILICRGYYAKTVLEAWDYRNGKLTKRWRFDTFANDDEYIAFEKQGAHSLRIGDVDGDGKDEVIYGACLIDHDGKGVYSTGFEHGDALHLSDLNPAREGLEVWMVHESSPNRAGSDLHDAATGELLFGYPGIADVGRGMTADIDPRFPGWEVWSSGTDGTYTCDGRLITRTKPSVNFAIWWDGDLNRELLDGGSKPNPQAERMMQQMRQQMAARPQGQQQRPQQGQQRPPQGAAQARPQQMPAMPQSSRFMQISKWNGNGIERFSLPGEEETDLNNGSKSNPGLSADILGDWREELVVRTKDNKHIRIYTTDIPTEYRFHTLMSDVIYRMSVLCENICYNQPPEPGHYLSSDLGKFWPVKYERDGAARNFKTSGDGLNTRVEGTREVPQNNVIIKKNIAKTYTLDARAPYDSYEWTVNGKVVSHDRTYTLKQSVYGYDKPISVHIKAIQMGQVFEDNGTVTFSSEEATNKGLWSDRDFKRTGRHEL